MTQQEEQLAYFGGDEYLASEYSVVKECPKSDSGYHCSCYDTLGVCDICGKHEHRRPHTCACSIQALEPKETCPIHGSGDWPPRCEICGKFMKRKENE
jgi:hypothetical protein